MEFHELPMKRAMVYEEPEDKRTISFFALFKRRRTSSFSQFFSSYTSPLRTPPHCEHQKWVFIHNSVELNGALVCVCGFNEVIIYFYVPKCPPTVWWSNDLWLCMVRFLGSANFSEWTFSVFCNGRENLKFTSWKYQSSNGHEGKLISAEIESWRKVLGVY